MRFEEEFNNAKTLFKHHKKKAKKAQNRLNASTAEWGSMEGLELELKLEMHQAAMARAESFMETFNPF